ncbi:hypothetical protein [Argonema galeatum]|uniref:hypothetical protein n=1 Tax=Argonema galeatum TaxID=2942762 RepID=UPI002011ABB4|nr:hypothetical protein [Argonema galeatum]MCL1463783.1 hypothetical protein [Argonema galeatum A003/A1]
MLTKFIATSAIVLTITAANVGIPQNAIAQRSNTTVPTRQILAKIKGKTQVPIFLPSGVPFPGRLYFNPQVTENGYDVYFDRTANCQGVTVCNIGSIGAEKGGQLITPLQGVTRTFKNIQLAGRTRGIFHNGCGAYCTATVQWQNQGVVYQVSVKNGREAETVQIANSAIQAGRR